MHSLILPLVSYLLVSTGLQSSSLQDGASVPASSAWTRRTARRRSRMNRLLSTGIKLPSILGYCQNTSLQDLDVPMLDAFRISWSESSPLWDPVRGGNIKPNSLRGHRKRRQIEAFYHILRQLQLPNNTTIVDAGCGAGNLAIAIAGFMQRHVLALDVNAMALERLSQRALAASVSVTTQCIDLQNAHLPSHASVVASLHACGAASDLALQLATRYNLPFVISPCCTAKSLTQRPRKSGQYGPNASFLRSGAPSSLVYPRSQWLREELRRYDATDKPQEGVENSPREDADDLGADQRIPNYYSQLARVADVGLGPQTPNEQVHHQKLAKWSIELDRLADVVERFPHYHVRLLRLPDQDGYGKTELLVGVPYCCHEDAPIEANAACYAPPTASGSKHSVESHFQHEW